VRFEITADFLVTRRFQEALRLGPSVQHAVRGGAFVLALLRCALAKSPEIDDVAHETAGSF
jgi:hypothetical protein